MLVQRSFKAVDGQVLFLESFISTVFHFLEKILSFVLELRWGLRGTIFGADYIIDEVLTVISIQSSFIFLFFKLVTSAVFADRSLNLDGELGVFLGS